MPRTVRCSLTLTVPEAESATALEVLAGVMAEALTDRGATYADIDATVEEQPLTPAVE